MNDVLQDLKDAARVFHKRVGAGSAAAVSRLRRHRELQELDDASLIAQARRRHCLNVLALELGFDDWKHLSDVVSAENAADFGTALHTSACMAHSNIWSANYEEASSIRAEHGGYLLAYRKQFLVVDRHYLVTLGLDPDAEDWERIGRDWVKPADVAARTRLYGRVFDARRQHLA